jgi:4,5-DOPA dioxygenase extradiol
VLRKDFLKYLAMAPIAGSVVKTDAIRKLGYHLTPTSRMPVLFMGHGNPMNAVEDNVFTRQWSKMAQDIPTPQAILIVSAHWETLDTKVYAGEKPKMIHDMSGFPKPLYEVDYPASGSPELANEIAEASNGSIAPTHDWGLDHGAWSVLVKMFPDANIPCFQLSLSTTRDFQHHYA